MTKGPMGIPIFSLGLWSLVGDSLDPVVSSQESKFCEIGSLRSPASRHCPLDCEGAGNQLHYSLQVYQLINIAALRGRRKLLNKAGEGGDLVAEIHPARKDCA